MKSLTIKCKRIQTSACILPDGTLIRCFDIERSDSSTTLSTEVEVEEGFVESIEFASPGWDYVQHGEQQSNCALTINTRYPDQSGFVPLLKGSIVRVELPHLKNGSQDEQALGLRTGRISVRSPKIGMVYFHISDVSFALRPIRDHETFPTFAEIQSSGKYLGHAPVKITAKK